MGIKKGVEPSHGMAELARKKGIEVIDGRAEKVPLETASTKQVLLGTILAYVDDKRKLKPSEIADSKLKPGKKLKYIGEKWSELQTIKYKANTQPLYVLMDHNEANLIKPVAYTPNVETYYNWLKKGVANFK